MKLGDNQQKMNVREGCPQPVIGLPCRMHQYLCKNDEDCRKEGDDHKKCCNNNGCGTICI